MEKKLGDSFSAPLSVVIPVYNAADFLREPIESILSQNFADFELILVNDGSKDSSEEIIKSFDDSRIRYFALPENKGLAFALNKGLSEAKGKYIVRMDGDDVSLPGRLEKQFLFMEANKDVGVCGTLARIIGGEVMNKSGTSSFLKASMLLNNVLVHPSVIIRKSILEEFNLHYDGFVEDYRLWVKIARVSKLAVIPEVLLHYRLSPNQFSVRLNPAQTADANKVKCELFEELMGRPLTEIELSIIEKRTEKRIAIHDLISFCENITKAKGSRIYEDSELLVVVQKLFITNLYFVKFRFFDFLPILMSRFLNGRQKISSIKIFWKSL